MRLNVLSWRSVENEKKENENACMKRNNNTSNDRKGTMERFIQNECVWNDCGL